MSTGFGKTWWGKQFLQSLNNIDYSNRLPRGSSYARKGAVQSIDIKENRISAKVAGSRPKPYNVDIIIPPFFDPELSNFINLLASKTAIVPKLLNRELDPEVLTLAEMAGLKVFPKQWTDFKMRCSCPDWAVPCKHLAATIYQLSTEIDNNPFLVFDLHKLDLLAEMKKRGMVVNKESVEIHQLQDLYFAKKPHPLPAYNEQQAYQKLSYSKLSDILEPLLSLLSPAPVFYQEAGDFKEKYSIQLRSIARNAQKITNGKLSLKELIQAAADMPVINTHSKEKLVINEEHITKVVINNKQYRLQDLLLQLVQIPTNAVKNYQSSTASLHTTLHFAVHLVANGAITPQLIQLPDKKYTIRWLPAVISKTVNELVQSLITILPPDIFLWQSGAKEVVINKDSAFNLLSVFITQIVSLLTTNTKESKIFLDLFFRKYCYPFAKPGEQALSGGVNAWLQIYYITQGLHKPQVVVEEYLDDSFTVDIGIINTTEKNAPPIALREILAQKKYANKKYEILQGLMQLKPFIKGLDDYINNNAKTAIEMNMETFTRFLVELMPAIQLLNIDILLPKSLQELIKPKASVRVKKKAASGKSFIRLDQLLDFDWQIVLGDETVSASEFAKLMKKADGLIKYKKSYIYVNKGELEKIYKHINNTNPLSSFQLLRAALSGEYQGAKINLTKEVEQLINEFTTVKPEPLPEKINATLRPYQIRGYSWLYRNAKVGFGSILADDMGLGKTLQVITTLLRYKQEGLLKEDKAIVVAPTGLLSNWEKEIKKFAPQLVTKTYHGTSRKFEKDEDFDVLITSYGIMRSDVKELKKKPWFTLIIDEAQNIKNNNTEQAKAIKNMSAGNFIALSGTPVENRLSELWSIFDYSNRGYLGSHKEFNDQYGAPIEQYNDEAVAEKLKKVTAPFLMRRLKTDKTIIADLPDKVEINCYTQLTKEQASLYEKTLKEAMEIIENADTSNAKALFVRQGLVLQMILALKQICNHPTQYLKNKVYDSALSGKMEQLFYKLDTIIEAGEKVLIFTQFTEMGEMLKRFIEERYKETPLFYHGKCSLKQRNEMVENFQNNVADKIFILSLKAAGTGLNLTAATHVIHYDLWWNPAVEAQATDRAYRIGQKNNVMVHRFITKNTFEEKIDEMIQSKKALANLTVATGENWIGNLSNKELRTLFEMSK